MSDKRKKLICYFSYHYENGDIKFVVEPNNYDSSFQVGSDVRIDGCLELGKIVGFERRELFIDLIIRPFYKDQGLHSPGSNVINAGETLLLASNQVQEADEPQPKQLRYVYFVSYKTRSSFGRCSVSRTRPVNNIEDIEEMEESIAIEKSDKNDLPILIDSFQLLRTEEI